MLHVSFLSSDPTDISNAAAQSYTLDEWPRSYTHIIILGEDGGVVVGVDWGRFEFHYN